MTREEAIMILKNEQPHCGKRALFPEEKRYEAYDVAIKALEQQTCEDAISRSEAIKALKDVTNLNGEPLFESLGLYPWNLLNELPSVQPKPTECEDAVSRQAVLDIFADNADATRPYSTAWEEVKALPPVTPQYTDVEIQKMQDLEQAEIQKAYELGKAEEPKIGHWKEYNKPYDIDGTYYCYCDNCGYIAHEKMDFCPDCKAKMIEPQESENDL